MFYESVQFSFTDQLQKHWKTIRDEFNALDPKFILHAPWENLYDQEKQWDMFGIYALEKKKERNAVRCPMTTQCLEKIPGMTTGGFSVLGPHTHIKPHVGYTGEVLRCHLGLIIPEHCAIRVGDETRQWQEGKVLVFDDTVEHEAWNKSDKMRVILLLDFKKASFGIRG